MHQPHGTGKIAFDAPEDHVQEMTDKAEQEDGDAISPSVGTAHHQRDNPSSEKPMLASCQKLSTVSGCRG